MVAVTITSAELAVALAGDLSGATAAHLLEVSTALVLKYAPDAPDAVQNEAVIRTSGYLLNQPSEAMSSLKVGEGREELTFTPSRQSALRHSGSMALLSPWKIRRAGLI